MDVVTVMEADFFGTLGFNRGFTEGIEQADLIAETKISETIS